MPLSPSRTRVALALASVLVAPPAHAAGAKERAAQRLYDVAMNEDFLNTDFAKAEKKLKDALAGCGDDGCSPEMVGKLHVGIGTLYALGLKSVPDAKAEFGAALKAYPKATLDPMVTTAELATLFEEAKELGNPVVPPDTPAAPPQAAAPAQPTTPAIDTQQRPFAEAPVSTPLPIYVEPSEEVPLSRVTLRYKPFGATQYKSMDLKRIGQGYGGEIPCEDVSIAGELRYFFAFTGADGAPAGGLGSPKDPFRVALKSGFRGDAPALPGKTPPEACREKVDCPPGFPGCPADASLASRGNKVGGAACERESECREGLACVDSTCVEDKSRASGTGARQSPRKMNLMTADAELDLLFVNGTTSACTSTVASPRACFLAGTSHQFFGTPVSHAGTNSILGGFAYADTRILLGYARQIVENLGLTLGLSVGFAVGGSPSPDNKPPAFANRAIQPANGFVPFHAEARASYFLLGTTLEKATASPYVFLSGGVSEISAGVPVALCAASGGASASKVCPAGSVPQSVDAYQISGLNFVGVGAGTTFGFSQSFGVRAELKVMFMVPTFGVVVAPTVGPAFAF